MKLSDVLTIISLFFGVTGGVFALYQWHRNIMFKRASYINELTEKIRSDSDIKDTVYLLDYGKTWYTEQFHQSGELELKVDKTLSYFSYICYLKRKHLITDSEFSFFEYEIKRILLNFDLKNYFYNLYHFSKKYKVPLTFNYLFEYGRNNRFFEKEFFDPEAYKTSIYYRKFLNF